MSEKLFVYGTLMFPEIRDVLTGRDFKTMPAVLEGYRRFAISLSGRAAVPAIVPDENASVSGLILLGVDRKSLRVFDIFEGVKSGLYNPERVEVDTEDGKRVEALTYVAGPAVRDILKGDWDADEFRTRHLKAYRRRVIVAWRDSRP